MKRSNHRDWGMQVRTAVGTTALIFLVPVLFAHARRDCSECRAESAAPNERQNRLDKQPQAAQEVETPERIANAIIRGRPEQNLVKVRNARYFVWYDGEGWHLRTASKGLVKFTGSIQLQGGGTFGRLRPVGLEKKGKNPDGWEVNTERTELRFQIVTGGSFDGFDFDVKTANKSTVQYQLLIGKDASSLPGRIFLGSESKHPPKSSIIMAAEPVGE